jgi:hypothetical protein
MLRISVYTTTLELWNFNRGMEQLLTDADLHKLAKKRAWALLYLFLGVAVLFIYMGIIGAFRESIVRLVRQQYGENLADFVPLALMFPMLGYLLVVAGIADYWINLFPLKCPTCATNVTRQTQRILRTRCCPVCNNPILEGKPKHSEVAYSRHMRMKERRMLHGLLWYCPMLCLLPLVLGVCVPSREWRQIVPGFHIALIGIVVPCWASIRMRSWRYVPQIFLSILVTALSIMFLFRYLLP